MDFLNNNYNRIESSWLNMKHYERFVKLIFWVFPSFSAFDYLFILSLFLLE